MSSYISFALVLVSALVLSSGSEDYYKLLNISKDATNRELRKAFKKAALEFHPDKNKDNPGAHDKFLLINRAYETLKDPDLRKRYDLFGEEGVTSSGTGSRRQYQSWSYYHDNFGIYDDDPEIVTLDRAEFEESVLRSSDIWFINFYSPGCSHCHDLAPEWRRMARELENVIRVGAVNCGEEWSLCRQQNIFSYPSLMIYPEVERYQGERTAERLVRHVLRRLRAAPIDVDAANLQHLSRRSAVLAQRGWLLFLCGGEEEELCASEDTRLKLAAMMEGVLNVGQVDCEETPLCDTLGYRHHAVYYPPGEVTREAGRVLEKSDAQEMAKEVLDLLPPLPTLTEAQFEAVRADLDSASPSHPVLPYLIQFTSDLSPSLELVRLPALLASTSLARVDCAALPRLCAALHVRKQPAFLLFKPASRGGGYEIYHGRVTAHDVAAFARDAAAAGLRALTPDDFPRVLADPRPRVVDFFAPWCPPCMRLLPELRRASARRPDVPFGSVDCTAHAELCSRYNIRSYPTVILYNASEPHLYRGAHTADGLLSFIQDTLSPAVVTLSSPAALERARRRPGHQLWLVDFFAGWCQPCQQFAPEVRRAARLLQPLDDVVVAMVDCAQQQDFCREQGIRSYPTVRLYRPGTKGLDSYSVYQGHRDAGSLRAWAVGFLPSAVEDVSEAQFVPRVLDGPGPWLIDFFTPWCGHCQVFAPEFAMIAKTLEGEVRCGRVDCQQHPRLCRNAGVRAYPTVKVYPGGGRLDMVGQEIDSLEPDQVVALVRRWLAEQRKDADRVKDDDLVKDGRDGPKRDEL